MDEKGAKGMNMEARMRPSGGLNRTIGGGGKRILEAESQDWVRD